MRYIVIPLLLNKDLHPSDKNYLTAWAPIRLEGPVSTFEPLENFLSEALLAVNVNCGVEL